MAQIECDVHYGEKENERGISVPAVTVTCGLCGHSVDIWGEGEDSVKRGLATLREECPKGKKNWYVEA